jgi:putative cofactor-binding repeat protein
MMVASPAWAETFTVDRIDDPIPVEGAGACSVLSNPPDCSLRGALEKSWPNGQADTIGFALPGAGPHTITLNDALTTGNEATDDLTINGPGQDLLIVKQSAAVRVFQIVGKTTINGVTISGGRSINNAGGILNNGGADLTLNDTTVTNNQARGAADAEPEGLGGGIYNASAATLTLNRSTVSGNTIANAGGGIYNANGALTLNNSTVSGNHASFVGGGIYSDTDLTGPIKTTVTNSTISGNTADFWGGGISNSSGLTVIEHSTITNNTAPCCGWGSGVSSHGDTATRTEVLSTIISDNTNTDVDFVKGDTNSFLSKGFNMIGDGNASVAPNNAFNNTGDQTGVANPGLNPDLASNGGPTQTHALLIGPAIDGGPSSCPATDQRGETRPKDGDGNGTATCDIGAFEKAADGGGGGGDTTSPEVFKVNPTGTGIPRTSSVTITFSEAMDEASVEAAGTFTLKKKGSANALSAAVTYDLTTKKATLNPTNKLRSGATYIATVTTAAKDSAGNALDQNSTTAGDQPKSWRFTVR